MSIRHIIAIASVAVLMSSQTFAQARVVEAGGSARTTTVAQAGNNELVVSLYNQLEALQQEVQSLRGLVEEQGNQIRRMQTEQRDRYLDVDRRLSELMPVAPLGGAPGAAPPVGATVPPVTDPANNAALSPPAAGTTQPLASTPSTALPPASTAAPPAAVGTATPSPPTAATAVTNSSTLIGAASQSPQDEQALYREALRLLLEEDKYIESIQMLQTYIDAYPQGRLLTNAIYWQGEAYLAIAEFNQAETMFNRLLTEFPNDPKAAGAFLKLGKVYEGRGDTARAREVWQQLPTRYPDAANEVVLARDYLRKL